METVKSTFGKVKNNWIGGIVGGAAFYYGSKKYAKVENKWAIGALTVVGVIVGAMVQSKIAAKSSAPTATTVKK